MQIGRKAADSAGPLTKQATAGQGLVSDVVVGSQGEHRDAQSAQLYVGGYIPVVFMQACAQISACECYAQHPRTLHFSLLYGLKAELIKTMQC